MQGTAKHVPLAIVSGSTTRGKQDTSMEVKCICQKCEKLVHYYDEEGWPNTIKGVFFDGSATTWLCKECDTPENRQEIYDAYAKKEYKAAYYCELCDSTNELEPKYCRVCKEEYEERKKK